MSLSRRDESFMFLLAFLFCYWKEMYRKTLNLNGASDRIGALLLSGGVKIKFNTIIDATFKRFEICHNKI